MKYEIICSGFGGQGSLTIGKVLAQSGMVEGKNVTWLPSYGPEMRGGTANVSVVISDSLIASPMVENPNVLIALNQPSVDKFIGNVATNGLVIINSDMAPHKCDRKDIDIVYIPMTKIAHEIGEIKVLNMIAVGVVIAKTKMVEYKTVSEYFVGKLKGANEKLLQDNLKGIDMGISYVQ